MNDLRKTTITTLEVGRDDGSSSFRPFKEIGGTQRP